MSSYRGSGGRSAHGGPPIRHGGSQQRKDAPYQPGPLEVIVNCFQVTQLPQRNYYHYDGKPKSHDSERTVLTRV